MKRCIAVVLAVVIGVFGMYTKHNFASGETLYASQLNEMDAQIKKTSDVIGEKIEEVSYIDTGSIKTSGAYTRGGSFFESNAYEHIIVECYAGDVFKASGTCAGSIVLAVFFRGEPSTETLIGAYSESISGTKTYTDELVTIPDGCTVVAFGAQAIGGFKVEKQKKTILYTDGVLNDINETNKRIDEIVGTKVEHSEFLFVEQTPIQGCYPRSTKDYWDNNNYRCIVCPCEDGDVFKVSANCVAAVVLATYYNGAPSPSTYIGAYSENLPDYTAYNDVEVAVPDGCRFVVFNDFVHYGPTLAVKKKKVWYEYGDGLFSDVQKSVDSVANTIVEYKIKDGALMLRGHYMPNYDSVIVMNNGRGNGLWDFAKFGLIPADGNLADYAVADIDEIWSSGTDWHAPFQIQAINNADGDDASNVTFTGGNHQYNNSGSGSTPTATSKYVRFYADGKPVTDGIGYAKHFTVEWCNGVQAYNTRKSDGSGREVLMEYHRMVYDGEKIEETVDLIANEELKILLWYGFQFSSRLTVYPNVRYIGGTNRAVTTDDSSSSGNAAPWGIRAAGNAHQIEMHIDTSFDIGKREHYSGTAGAFTANGKAYFNTVSNLTIHAGEMYSMRGGYRFSAVE